jgi:hypothetical protein
MDAMTMGGTPKTGTPKGLDLSPEQIKRVADGLSIADLMGAVHAPGFPDRIGNYQYTAHGRLFFSCDPRPEEVFIDDIARHLSRICRFGGATKRWMSVAEHCILCSMVVKREVALEALLHDGAEAYIGDVIRPLKYLPVYSDIYLKLERQIEVAIANRFNLVFPYPEQVRWADEVVVGAELKRNIVSNAANYLSEDFAGDVPMFHYWTPEEAEERFLSRFRVLAEERGLNV